VGGEGDHIETNTSRFSSLGDQNFIFDHIYIYSKLGEWIYEFLLYLYSDFGKRRAITNEMIH